MVLYILQFFWILNFFEIFYGVVLKVFVKVIMSESPYLFTNSQLFPIIFAEWFLILFFAKFLCSFFSCLILIYLSSFKYCSNKCFSIVYECVAKILNIVFKFYHNFVFLRIQWRLIFANVIRCSRPRLWEDYFIYFKSTPVFFYLMF